MKIIMNPDKEYTNEVIAKLKANDGYCPCQLVKSPDTKCMCKEFREMSEGTCSCGLYIKIEDANDKRN